MTRRILILSGKGGVGKTSLVSNLAVALAEIGENIIAMDANLTTPNLGLHLGLHLAERTIHDVLKKKADLKDATYYHPLGIRVIPGSLNINKIRRAYVNGLPELTLSLAGRSDYILLDCAAGFGPEVLSALSACDEVIVITNPDFPSVIEAFKGIKIARQEGKEVLGVVVNKIKGNEKLKKAEIEEILGVPVLAEIPEDENLPASISAKIPLVNYKPNSPAAKEIRKLAYKISRKKMREKGFLEKILAIFKGS